MGLATLFLPDKSFYKKYSRHFAHDGEIAGPTSMAELRARRLRREASKAQLAEGEEILVKCNALCDGNGPVLSQLYDASGTPEQCTIDCAAAYGELFSVTGSQAKSDTKLSQKGEKKASAIEKAQLAEGEEILVKCNALCDRNGPVLSELYDASGTPAQCTIDCAAAYGEFFSGVGKQNLTEPAREASRFVQASSRHPSPSLSPSPGPNPHPTANPNPNASCRRPTTPPTRAGSCSSATLSAAPAETTRPPAPWTAPSATSTSPAVGATPAR